MNIDLGAGVKPRKGFVTVDLYEKARVKADVRHLPFQGGTVDILRASHILEHFPNPETLSILQEWCRVLKPGGLIWLEVPDFAWCLRRFLELPECARWDWPAGLIFGRQEPGNYHLAGFSTQRLDGLMHKLGCEGTARSVFSHCMRCIRGIYTKTDSFALAEMDGPFLRRLKRKPLMAYYLWRALWKRN